MACIVPTKYDMIIYVLSDWKCVLLIIWLSKGVIVDKKFPVLDVFYFHFSSRKNVMTDHSSGLEKYI